jgi:hypothetical protein
MRTMLLSLLCLTCPPLPISAAAPPRFVAQEIDPRVGEVC